MSAGTVLGGIVAVCLAYLALVNVSYLALALAGLRENRDRRRESDAEDYETLARSRFTIPVSVILAAFDEEPAICATVRSLLALEYPEHEVIVVDDGSRDGTLARLVEEFELVPYEVFPRRIVETAPVRAVYRSGVDPRLRVVEKENGGKADALNAGLNHARYRYVCGVDADTVFARDALLKGMRLAMSDPARVIGVTSHLTIALDPEATMAEPPGRRRVERRPFVAYQHLDYLRAFFNNRLAWSRYGFMLCAVGAFQLWRRDVLEEVGGYARGFTCEDIELTFRVHEHYRRLGRDYAILCLPDNVGTTEGPDTIRKLVAQRERWQRVIDESVWHYRRMLGNPRYGAVGLVGTPFYLVSEVLAPVFELLALVSLPLALALGVFDWAVFGLVLVAVAFGNAALTGLAILSDDLHSRLYRRRDLARLLLLAPLDLVLYRPILMWARLKGTWRFLRRDKGWYKFERNARGAGASA
jgi:cellulose synthase/poly-beta-1,6-N-acetylglucosamine synthase-like glycosyltransferase